MQRQSRGERIACLVRRAITEPNFREMEDRGEVARLELECALDVLQALLVASLQVVERGAIVPGLGIERGAAHERRQPGFSDVVAPCSDVARCGFEDGRCGTVRMMHPDAPDAVLGLCCFGCRACAESFEKMRQLCKVAGRPSATTSGNQAEDLGHG